MDDDLKKIQKDVDEMNKTLDGLGETQDATDAPGTAAPGTQSSGTEAPGTAAPGTEAPSTTAPATTAPATEVPEDESEKLKKENEDLRKRIDEMSALKTSAPGTVAPATDIPVIDKDFIGEQELSDIYNNAVDFNKILNTVYKSAINDARKVLGEGVLRSIPDIVKANVTMIGDLQKASDTFYKDNPDLEPFKRVVAATFEEVASENPGKVYDEILGDVADEVRKRLELHRQATSKDKEVPPRLPHKKGQQRQSQRPSIDPLLAEIDEMDKSLNQ